MRDPFAYESNVALIRSLLVPDPLQPVDWNRSIREWEGSDRHSSLLEWLVTTGTIPEVELLRFLAETLGTRYLKQGEFTLVTAETPEEQMLEAHGFRVGQSNKEQRFLSGGISLPPRIQSLVPTGEVPPWALVSPIRSNPPSRIPVPDETGWNGAELTNWLKEIIASQISMGASDIHFERSATVLKIRIHREGEMQTVGTWEDGRSGKVLMILKRWAAMTTAATTLPQDGRIHVESGGRTRVLRISHLCTVDGESAVLRLPEPKGAGRGLDSLGLPDSLREDALHAIWSGKGLILVCGATGSGKTTTAYALLQEMGQEPIKILTIEDPVERELDFAVQSSVNLNAGWTFSAALRAFLRQDPDLVFLGEMRDRESAMVACRAALTGHCVLATLHAGGIDMARARLAAWGIPEGILEETLGLVLHQAWPEEKQASRHPVFRWKCF